MKIKISVLIISIIIILCACSDKDALDSGGNGNYNDIKRTIDLTFTPIPKQSLIEGLPKNGWIKGKSIYYGNLSNQIEATVHLYVDNDENIDLESDEGVIYGFLEHEGKLYELGVVSNYGIDSVNINLADRTFDGMKEIEIDGGMGAAYLEMKIIRYDQINKEWENILTMGSPQIADLDKDGQEEIIGVSAGSLPPYVDIYKWNNDHFEKADIVNDTESTYANLYTIDGEWLIETGKYENEKTTEATLYKYEAGKLKQQ